jgi:hypothetical protein
MRRKFLLGILILIGFVSCNHKKEEPTPTKTSSDLNELKKYIDVDNVPIDSCIFEFSKKGIKNPRTEIGLSDYQLIAVLKYSQGNFNEIVKKISENKKYDNIFLNEDQIRTWFPDSFMQSLKNEDGYYHLDNSYPPDFYILKENSMFNTGFCFIGNNETILIYLHTD